MRTSLYPVLFGRSRPRFDIASWFSGGAPGVAYDFTDLSRMFQDRGASSPATAVGQSVGAVMDLARGDNPVGNQLLINGGGPFTSITGWATEQGATFTVVSGEGVLTNTAAVFGFVSTPFATIVGQPYRVTVTGRRIVGSNLNAQIANSAGTTEFASVSISSTTKNSSSLIFVATANTTFLRLLLSSVNGASVAVESISVQQLLANPLIAPTDSRRGLIGTSANGKFHVACDGTRAYATAAAVNFAAVDEVTAVIAARANSNAIGVFCELGANTNSTNGSFVLYRNNNTTMPYGAASRGTSLRDTLAAFTQAPPDLLVLVLSAKIGAPRLLLDRNGSNIISDTVSQGSGNYGNHVLNVACRNAASPSVMLDGQLSRMALIGGAVSAGTLAQMVAWARDGNNAY